MITKLPILSTLIFLPVFFAFAMAFLPENRPKLISWGRDWIFIGSFLSLYFCLGLLHVRENVVSR